MVYNYYFVKSKKVSKRAQSMILYQVQTGVLSIVKVNRPNEHVYQLNYVDNGDSTHGFKVSC